MASRHTPLPWKVSKSGLAVLEASLQPAKGYPNGEPIAHTFHREFNPVRKANATFIVMACNSHYELLAWVKDALRELKEHALNGENALCHVPLETLVEQGESLIAKATTPNQGE